MAKRYSQKFKQTVIDIYAANPDRSIWWIMSELYDREGDCPSYGTVRKWIVHYKEKRCPPISSPRKNAAFRLSEEHLAQLEDIAKEHPDFVYLYQFANELHARINPPFSLRTTRKLLQQCDHPALRQCYYRRCRDVDLESLLSERFGKWKVTSIPEKVKKRGLKVSSVLPCECECGRRQTLIFGALRDGQSKSCLSCAAKNPTSQQRRVDSSKLRHEWRKVIIEIWESNKKASPEQIAAWTSEKMNHKVEVSFAKEAISKYRKLGAPYLAKTPGTNLFEEANNMAIAAEMVESHEGIDLLTFTKLFNERTGNRTTPAIIRRNLEQYFPQFEIITGSEARRRRFVKQRRKLIGRQYGCWVVDQETAQELEHQRTFAVTRCVNCGFRKKIKYSDLFNNKIYKCRNCKETNE